MKRYGRKENTRWSIGRCMLMIAALCLAGCSDEVDENERRGDTLHLLTYSMPFREAPANRAVTVPEDYVPFAVMYPEAVSTLPSIGLFTMSGDKGGLQSFQYQANGTWQSDVRVSEDTYYLYGFMPLSAFGNKVITSNGTGYADGATLSLQNLPSLTFLDPCVTVGVLGVTSPSEEGEVKVGNFLYNTHDKGQNYVYMLFDHLYAGIRFSIRVDEQYAKLRTIRLKRMTLSIASQGVTDIDVTLVPGSEPVSSVIYTQRSTTGLQLPVCEYAEGMDLTTEYESIGQTACFAPAVRGALKLVSEYDVYDRKGNLVRKNCRAENLLSTNLPIMERGQRRTVRLTVNPTYLYQLSEPELDNPTVNVE